MSKKLFFFIFISFLNISYQLNCRTFGNDPTCGGHNTKYNLKCLKFTGESYCTEIEYDDGCTMTNDKKCTKEDEASTSYQCLFFPGGSGYNPKCRKLNVDNYCYFDNNNKCEKRTEANIPPNHKCKENSDGTECKYAPFECSDFDINKCKDFDNGKTCFKVNGGYSQCKIVSVDNKCEINDIGNCVDKSTGGPDVYEKCQYNNIYTECKPVNKDCSDMDLDKCDKCQSLESNHSCKKIDGSCKDVQIDSSCQINESGECERKNPAKENSICQFENDKSICKFYDFSSNCKLSQTEIIVNCNDGDDLDSKRTCKFVETTTKKTCQDRPKTCSDHNNEQCEEGIIEGTNIKCSWSSGMCKKYTIDDVCTVTNGLCNIKEDVTDEEIGSTHDCLFDYLEQTCNKKQKVCGSYYKSNECELLSQPDGKKCVKFNENNYCKIIDIDTDCEITSPGNSRNCKGKSSIASSKKCIFDKQSDPSSCKVTDKTCQDYDQKSDCNSVQNCAFYDDDNTCYPYTKDNDCIVQNGECKDGENIGQNHKCVFEYKDDNKNSIICKKINKDCDEYTDSKICNNAPKIDDEKCYYISSKCKELYLDDKCTLNSENKCIDNGAGKLSSNEVCYKYEDDNNISCYAKEKLCSDYEDDKCGSFTPEMKLCFNVGSDGDCEKVTIDAQCSMNENNKCTGDSCQFDKENNRCYYQNNDGSLLKKSQIILLVLLFIL